MVEIKCQVSSCEGTKGRNSSNLRMGSWVGSQGLCKTYMVKKRSWEMAQLTVRSERERDFWIQRMKSRSSPQETSSGDLWRKESR